MLSALAFVLAVQPCRLSFTDGEKRICWEYVTLSEGKDGMNATAQCRRNLEYTFTRVKGDLWKVDMEAHERELKINAFGYAGKTVPPALEAFKKHVLENLSDYLSHLDDSCLTTTAGVREYKGSGDNKGAFLGFRSPDVDGALNWSAEVVAPGIPAVANTATIRLDYSLSRGSFDGRIDSYGFKGALKVPGLQGIGDTVYRFDVTGVVFLDASTSRISSTEVDIHWQPANQDLFHDGLLGSGTSLQRRLAFDQEWKDLKGRAGSSSG